MAGFIRYFQNIQGDKTDETRTYNYVIINDKKYLQGE